VGLTIDGCHCFRTGRSLGTTVYAQWDEESSTYSDTYLAVFNNRAWGADIVTALNGALTGDPCLLAVGRLLYPSNATAKPLALDDFVGVAISPEIALYIAVTAKWYSGADRQREAGS
jgi:hypothetical protein